MSQFTELVTQKNYTDPDILSLVPERVVCVCCLAQNVRFINLATCKHRGFLYMLDFTKMFSNAAVCYLCHNMLKKFDEFRHQVKQSILVLNKQIHHTTKSYNLEFSAMKYLTVGWGVTEKIEKKEGEIKYEYQEVTGDTGEVYSDMSDVENDMPLSEIKKQKAATECHIVKKEFKPKSIKREKAEDSPLIGEKYIGKVEMLLLTQEDLQKEREMLKTEEKYMKLPYKCEKCVIGFNREVYLKKHCKQRHETSIGKYICGICETVFVSKIALNPHFRKHFIRYECKSCSKRYIDERSVVIHYNEKHDRVGGATVHNKYQCKIADCGFETHSYRSIIYHRTKHVQYPCNICGKIYLTWAQLRSHIYGVHNAPPTIYKCEHCDKQYKQRCGLRLHLQSAHGVGGGGAGGGGAPYCVPCRMHFRTTNILHHHLKHHSNHVKESDKKYMCDECGARFSTKTYMKGHIEWVHLKKSNFQCPLCSKIFRRARSLNNHVNYFHEKKAKPRTKMCDYCAKAFITRRALLAHIRTHTGERPFECEVCSAKFSHSASLYNHKRIVHDPLRGDTRRRKGNKLSNVLI